MEPEGSSNKYQKLAAEYSKIRAQASVLKRAVLDEQSKNAALRESLRVKEANLRKSEQEADSLGFRNKQLERRVAALQESLDHELRRTSKGGKGSSDPSESITAASIRSAASASETASLIAEELQKKLAENAQLTVLVEDGKAELAQCQLRLDGLNRELQQQASVEQKLRKELEALTLRNAELEAKISEAASTIGSEDGLSVNTDLENHYGTSNNSNFNSHSNQNLANAMTTTGASGGAATASSQNCDDRIVFLEKELGHWRAQYELLKIEATSGNGSGSAFGSSISSQNRWHPSRRRETADSAPYGGASDPSSSLAAAAADDDNQQSQTKAEHHHREAKLTERFSQSIADLFHDKCRAEAKLASHLLESQRLQSHLEIMKARLKECEESKREEEQRTRIIEDELARTRLNYEEQISVLTEQVINLSDQLANSK